MMRDPRWKKTFQIIMLAVFAYWLGHLDAEPDHTARWWILMAAFAMGIAGSLYLLLRPVWKPDA